jgi:hypothetical protein
MVRGIEADLENWTISAVRGTGTRFIVPKRRVLQPAGAAADQEEHRIEDVENIKDVLGDMEKEKPQT